MQLTLFSKEIGQSILLDRFGQTSLGQLHSVLPLESLANQLPAGSPLGVRPWFDNRGKIALQFLKAYIGCSDDQLLERLNTDWSCQLFCGIYLGIDKQIKDKDLIWRTRKWVGEHLDLSIFQGILIDNWKPLMEQTHIGLSDATCYESYIAYPTDSNLLWKSVSWLYKGICKGAKALGLRRPRSKYKELKQKWTRFLKRRKKTRKQERRMRKSLLYLCNKLLLQLERLIVLWQEQSVEEQQLLPLFTEQDLNKYLLIGKVYEQQRLHFEKPEESIANRIVNLHKPYLRPIVRGKENMNGKRVEFGAKVNTWQVDGINFIEHISFNPFHEGNRLGNGIAFHHRHFGKLRGLGADAIYATNANRRLCRKLNITTSFRPKGRRVKDEQTKKQQDTLRKAIAVARATVLEGSYGNDKNHYALNKIKARNKKTEIVWIFFGMMCANAVKISKRMNKKTANHDPPTQLKLAA